MTDEARPGCYERLRGGDEEPTRHVCVVGVSERDDEALRELSGSFGKVLSIERNAKVGSTTAVPGSDSGELSAAVVVRPESGMPSTALVPGEGQHGLILPSEYPL